MASAHLGDMTARTCWSTSPDGDTCCLTESHGPQPHRASAEGREWTGGIRKPARWADTPQPTEQCPSRSPDETQCAKPVGHRRRQHRATSGREWTGGIRAAAKWETRESESDWDSEAAFIIRGRYGI